MSRPIRNRASVREPATWVLAAILGIGSTLLLGSGGRGMADEPVINPDEAESRVFREKIEPVLEQRCYGCHSVQAGVFEGSLQLDSRAGIRQGGDSGPALIPGDPEQSLLIRAIRHQDFEMPPDEEPLAQDIIEDFVKWIEMGAPDPRDGPPAVIERYDWEEARSFWAFQPLRRAALPDVRKSDWVRNWVDSFVLARLEAEQLEPAPPATPRELVRRLHFDLTGLPPPPEEIEVFLSDPSDDAYEQLVDRLLASPHYGERWGQHWLDVVRYAETEGFEYDGHLPGAWRYRDYVIHAYNSDKPYHEFVREQLAGDQLDSTNDETLAAAIFHRLGPVRRNAGNPEIALSRNEVLTERTDIVGAAFLGLTMGCARCHDHKLDPILQADYYRLQAYMAATAEFNVVLADAETQAAWSAVADPLQEQIKSLRKKASGAPANVKQEIQQQVEALEKQLPPPLPSIPTIRDDDEQRTAIHVLRRGQWEAKGDPAAPRPPTVLVPPQQAALPPEDPQLRRSLAEWLTDPAHPLTPRVYVNRLWQHHFRRGLVGTPNDFGSHGERPSHPELLDALALEFIRTGWHAKPLHRLLVLSSTYRQSSLSPHSELGLEVDPENRWLWHYPRRRLSAEEIRDAILAVAGMLSRDIGGPSILVPVDQELVDLLYNPSQWNVTSEPSQQHRRSIYLISKRNLRLPLLEVFDQPTALTSCGRRDSTTHARQALELLNGSLTNQLAGTLAERLRASVPDEEGVGLIVDRAYLIVCGRPPSEEEAEIAQRYLDQNPLEEFALAMLNLHGFLYVD